MAEHDIIKRQGNVTLKDIANHVGTSVATVSLVVNRARGHERISAQTRAKVLDACREYNYFPHFFAQGLKSEATMQILLAIVNINNQFSPPLIQGVKSILSPNGYNTIILDFTGNANQPDESELPFDPIVRLARGGVDGVISHVSTQAFLDIIGPDMPMVYIDQNPTLVPGIGFDANAAAYMLTKLFLERGCTKIAFIGADTEQYTYIERFNGYCRALAEWNLQVDPSLTIFVNCCIDGAAVACDQLLAMPSLPEAVCVFTDSVAHPLQMMLVNRGILIPEDLGFASIDDTMYSRFMVPPLTSVHVPAYEIGRQAGEMMIATLKGTMTAPQYQSVDTPLFERASSKVAINDSDDK